MKKQFKLTLCRFRWRSYRLSFSNEAGAGWSYELWGVSLKVYYTHEELRRQAAEDLELYGRRRFLMFSDEN